MGRPMGSDVRVHGGMAAGRCACGFTPLGPPRLPVSVWTLRARQVGRRLQIERSRWAACVDVLFLCSLVRFEDETNRQAW